MIIFIKKTPLLFTSNVEAVATREKSATVVDSPATHVEAVKNVSKISRASYIFFSRSSLFGTPAKIQGYYNTRKHVIFERKL